MYIEKETLSSKVENLVVIFSEDNQRQGQSFSVRGGQVKFIILGLTTFHPSINLLKSTYTLKVAALNICQSMWYRVAFHLGETHLTKSKGKSGIDRPKTISKLVKFKKYK